MQKQGATLIGLVAIVTWAFLALLSTLAGAIPPFQLAAMTFLLGGLTGAASWTGRPSAIRSLRQPWQVWALGTAGLCIYHCLYFFAIKAAPPVEVSLIAYLWPLLIVLFSALLPGERLGPRHILGAVLGLAGAIVLFASKAGGGLFANAGGAALAGYGLALCCAFVWSAYSLLSRRLKAAPTEAVAGFCLATAALAALCHFAFETTIVPDNAGQWLAILGLGLGPVGLAFYVWDYGVKNGDIRLLGVAAYAAPVLSTLILVAAGFAPATPSLAIACALIVAGAAIASFKPKEAQ